MADEDKSKEDYFEHPLIKPNKIVRRLYQERIFASSINKNTLVVLPTARGKTIIALLLAVYHLSEDIDKLIIFLAPTKPLVVQHRESFIELTNLEEWQLNLFTGSISPNKREKLYLDTKIAFMTPQVLQNDIVSNRIDLKNVSLIIFDEAHRSVGNYAYTFIADIYMTKNPSGHILAMSASPGGDKAKIEEVCKNLKIEHVEVRTDDSPDVRPYVQKTYVNWIKLEFPIEFMEIKKKLEKILEGYYKKLYEHDVIDSKSVNMVSRKAILEATRKIDLLIKRSRDDDELSILFNLKKVSSNAVRISHMLELLETQGLIPLYKYIQKNIDDIKKGHVSKSLQELFSSLEMRESIDLVKKMIEGNYAHPKLKKISQLLRNQFKKNPDSRVLIFTNFRDSVLNILDYLKDIPEIKAEKFVGQANRKSGNKVMKGLKQKDQVEILNKFKSGEYNTLVATSVAEEGLDIAECDLVIFYDVVPSEIRTIQRRGRTGRKSSGEIYILMTKGTREEAYYYAEKRREREMKSTLLNLMRSGIQLEENIRPKIRHPDNKELSPPQEGSKSPSQNIGPNISNSQGPNPNEMVDSITITKTPHQNLANSNINRNVSQNTNSRVSKPTRSNAATKKTKLTGLDAFLQNSVDNTKNKKRDNPSAEIENRAREKERIGEQDVYKNKGSEAYKNKEQGKETKSGGKTETEGDDEVKEEFIAPEDHGFKSSGYTILVDSREKSSTIISKLIKKGFDIVLKPLKIADYIISDEVGIERKEALDFNRSIIDGRLFTELFELKNSFQRPVLIIEGDPLMKTGISKEAILGAISAVIINMNITVLKTENAEETADILIAMTKKAQENKEPKWRLFTKKSSSIPKVQEQIIGSFPGLNLIRTQKLLTEFSTIKNIINADIKDLQKVQGIGIKTAQKIHEIAEYNYNSEEN
ncbi:MAG: helicase-related protein [Promethearchaeota archaeon]